jgi:hypothetical protein
MRTLIGDDAVCPQEVRSIVPAQMLAELDGGYEEISGCVVPKGYFGPVIEKSNEDETGIECGISKMHVGDFIDEAVTNSAAMIRIGISYAMALKDALIHSQVEGPFRIIIAGDEGSGTCVIRFHRVRPRQKWLLENLEEYKNGPVMTIDF